MFQRQAPGRGMNIAVIRPGGLLESFQVFDTHAAGSEALPGFVGDFFLFTHYI